MTLLEHLPYVLPTAGAKLELAVALEMSGLGICSLGFFLLEQFSIDC